MAAFHKLVLVASLIARDCGTADNNGANTTTATGEPWEQVFATWTCTAAGRDTFSFKVNRLSQFGADHEWQDGGAGATQPARVELTQLYLQKVAGTPFRNFEYKTQATVLTSLDEWSLTANGATPYRCVK